MKPLTWHRVPGAGYSTDAGWTIKRTYRVLTVAIKRRRGGPHGRSRQVSYRHRSVFFSLYRPDGSLFPTIVRSFAGLKRIAAREIERRRAAALRDFGKLAGEIHRELDAADEFLDDPITVASSCDAELLPSVLRGAQKKIAAVLDRAGLTAAGFDAELQRRTSDRFAYLFGSVNDFMQM